MKVKKVWIKDETGKRLYTTIVNGEAVLKPAKPVAEESDDNWTYNKDDFVEEQDDEQAN